MPKVHVPLEILIQQLHGEDWTARCSAARLLGHSRDPRAVDALLPDLNDPDWRVRRNAAQALGALRDKRAVEPLLQALKDRTMTVRQRGIVALGRIKDPRALPALLDIFIQNRRESYDAGRAIRKFGKKALPETVKAFERMNTQPLLLLLIEMNYEGSFELLIKLLGSQELPDRLKALEELGKLGNRKAVPHLIKHLQDNNPLIQGEVVRALGALGAVETIPDLLDLLIDDELYGPRSNVYHAVTETFQTFGNIKEEINRAFPGNYPAMFNLGGAPFSLPQAMGLFGNNPGGDFPKEALARLQSDTPKDIEFPPGLPTDILRKGFEDMAWKFGVMFADARDASQERVKRLMELLKSELNLTRSAAALTLPWYSNEASLQALEQSMQDPDEIVRKTAAWAFCALQKVISYRRQFGT